ncbi:pyocin knob domain-containing protein [Glutamicibacter sp. AGC13]
MAVEQTSPHGLKKYTAGTDPIPGRVGHNLMVDQINMIPGLGIGPLSSRPAPSFGLRFWVEESTKRLSVNLGTEWVGIANLGGIVTSGVMIGGTSSEGVSDRAARGDHVHALPLATSTAPGAMSSDDKAKLDAASSVAGPNTLLRANANGDFSVRTPTAGSHPAHKTYVDGLVAPLAVKQPISLGGAVNLDNLRTTEDYLQTQNANAASGANYPLPLAGRLRVVAATNGLMVWQYYTTYGLGTRHFWRAYYENTGTDGAWSAWNESRTNVATTSEPGLFSPEDKTLFNNATALPSNNSLCRRNEYGGIQFHSILLTAPQQADINAVVRKDYLDAQISGRAPASHTHSATQTTSGVFSSARLPDASSSAKGAMSITDKNKLDKMDVRSISAGSGTFPALAATGNQGPYTHRASVNITFPTGLFAAAPTVVAQLLISNPGQFSAVGVSNISSTGATLWVSGIGTAPVGFHWQAVLQA